MRHGDTGTRQTDADGWTSDRPRTVSKRPLVAASHAIEAAVLAGPVREPTVVVALFQRLAYFEREYNVYARMAAAGVVVVIAFADGEVHQIPPGCHLVVLDPAEPLVDEWSVVAVAPEAGGYLVATDLHRSDPSEHSVEAGREFTGRWGFSRVQAANELARMRAALGPRLDPAVAATIDRLLAQVMPAGGAAAPSAGTDGERWATHSLHRMVERMYDVREGNRMLRDQLVDAHLAVSARAAAQVDAQSGLTTPEFLARWSGAGGPNALPVGVALFDVAGLERAEERFDRRAAYHAARRAAAAVSEPLGPVDAAVRLSEREFALVVPGASSRHLAGLVAAALEQLELSSDGYPNVPLAARVAWTVTRARPLPLDDLHVALGRPDGSVTLPGHDRIVVVSPRPAGRTAEPDAEERPQRTDPPTHGMVRIGPSSRPPGDPAPEPEPADEDRTTTVSPERDPLGDADLPRDGDRPEAEDPLGPLVGAGDPLGTRDPLADPLSDPLGDPGPAAAPSPERSAPEEDDATAAGEEPPPPATTVVASTSRRPTPARRRTGGEPGLSMLAGLPRRDRRSDDAGDDGASAALFHSEADVAEGDRPTAS